MNTADPEAIQPNIKMKLPRADSKPIKTDVLPHIAAMLAKNSKPAGTPIKSDTIGVGLPWPLMVRIVARMRSRQDRGVGDTLARVFNAIPAYRGMGAGDAFKAFMKKIGKSCGCENRQETLNEWYPYKGKP